MAGVSRQRGSEGAAAVEFALIVLPIVLLLFGLVQYGLYFWAMQGGSDIARSAARLAAVGNPATCTDFRSDIQGQIDRLVGSGQTISITRTYNGDGEVEVGDTVEVVVKFKSIDMKFPFLPFIDDGRVTSTAEARVDYVPSQPETCS